MMKQAVIIYGPPGSGKGTQAELLARKFGLVHFDTGRFIESVVHDKSADRDPVLRRERKLFDSGKLCTPAWVFRITSAAVRNIAGAGFGIVFSGSPRTEFEAFGSEKQEGLVAILEKLYGKKNISVFSLAVKEQSSIRRNSSRFVCSVCGLPILARAKEKRCALCAGPMRTRTLDNPAVIKVRLKEYEERTAPILKRMRKQGLHIFTINGEPLPYLVFRDIAKRLDGNA